MNQNTIIAEELAEMVKSAVITVGDGRGFVVRGTEVRYIITAANCLHCPFTERPYEPDEHERRPSRFERASRVVLGAIDEGFERVGRLLKPPPPPPPRHWLPFLRQDAHELCEPQLLGPLGEKPTVYARCIFLDPIADLAVLGSPPWYAWGHKEADEYEAFTRSTSPLRISDASEHSRQDETTLQEKAPVWLLSLAGELVPCNAGYWSCLVDVCAADTLRIWTDPDPRNPYNTHPGIFATPDIMNKMSGTPVIVADGSAAGVLTGYYTRCPRLTCHLPGWLLREFNASPTALAHD